MIKRYFMFGDTKYAVSLNEGGSKVSVAPSGNLESVIMTIDNHLDVYDSQGCQIGTIVVNDGQVQGFMGNVKVADDFSLYEVAAQFAWAYLKKIGGG